jgi:transposase
VPLSADDLFKVEIFDPMQRSAELRPQLPGRATPLQGEALSSWLLRFAEPFGLAPETLLFRHCDAKLASGTGWWRRPHPMIIDGISQRTGVSVDDVRAMTFAAWPDNERSDDLSERFSRSRFQAMRSATRRTHRTTICPLCFAADEIPYIRRDWTVGWVVACSMHRTVLVSECSNCGTKLRLPPLSSQDSFAADHCTSCAFQLRLSQARRAHNAVIDLQGKLLEGRAQGGFNLNGNCVTKWSVAMALFDVLLGTTWIDTKIKARRQLFARIARDLGREELGDEPPSNHGGLLILAWMLDGWPDRVRAAFSILRAPRPRRQIERWQALDDSTRRLVGDLLIPTCSDESHIPDRAWWRTWIDNMPETGDDLRARASKERFPHRRARLLAIADVRDGVPVETAAEMAGVRAPALYCWLKRGAADGIEAALDRQRGALSQSQTVEIAQWIGEAPVSAPRWRASHVRNEVRKRYGLEINLSVAGRLLRNYGPWRRRAPIAKPRQPALRPQLKEHDESTV